MESKFSDDDLRTLKEIISVNVHAQINESIFDHEFLKDLLARLEAAEKLNGYANHTYHCGVLAGGNQCECGFDRNYEAWRRSKGDI